MKKDTRTTHEGKFTKNGSKFKLVAIVDTETPLLSTSDKEMFSVFKCFKDGEKVIEFYLPVAYNAVQVKDQFDLMKHNTATFIKATNKDKV